MVKSLGLEQSLIDPGVYDHSVKRFREESIALPTFGELSDPAGLPPSVHAALAGVDRDAPDPRNLYRVHWYNGRAGPGLTSVPDHLLIPSSLTGVPATIVMALGDRFPMIRAHKVLAAYACLAPRIVTGQFDPTTHRAVWPSTGNYARGGVAISRIMGCRGTAVLPEHMSQGRFDWLESWVTDPSDIIRTPGSESNVKEIYDACDELAADPANVIFNQFCEFPNYLVHYLATGAALGRVLDDVRRSSPRSRLRAFVSASGSAGTLGAGDYLKDEYGSLIVAVEALECPTMLYNGYGEHNIQGIGDKHIPLIHNVMNTDLVTAVSDRSTDALDVLFNTRDGRSYLVDRAGVDEAIVSQLGDLGLSSICNLVAAIKVAKHLGLDEDDVIVTVATDSAELYAAERAASVTRLTSGRREAIDQMDAARLFGEHLVGIADDHLMVLSDLDRARIFNLGYYTWVEQQGIGLADFEARRNQEFWRSLRELPPVWDDMIREFNSRTGVLSAD